MDAMRTLMTRCLALCCCAVFPLGSGCATSEVRTLSITGEGVVMTKPDGVTVRCLARSTQTDLKEAKRHVDERVSSLFKSLSKLSTDKDNLQAGQVIVQMEYEWTEEGNREFIGYGVVRPISVTLTDLSEVNSLFDAIVSAGIDEIDSVKFYSSQEKTFLQEAEKLAMQDAIQRATLVAMEGNTRLGKIDSISIPRSASPWDFDLDWDSDFIETGRPVSRPRPFYTAGTVEIRATANVTWVLLD
jgi:hypothetical protein